MIILSLYIHYHKQLYMYILLIYYEIGRLIYVDIYYYITIKILI